MADFKQSLQPSNINLSQPVFTCSKTTMETLEHCVKSIIS